MRANPILVVGDVMTDIIAAPEGPLVRGSDRRATIRSRPGGSGANQAVWLAAMGIPVRLAARVGAAEKAHLDAYFGQRGVETVLATDATLPSGMLVTIVDADGERSFLTDRGANLALVAADLPVWLLDGARLLLTSGYSYFAPGPRAAVTALTAAARKRGIGVMVDAASAGFIAEVGAARFLAWTDGAAVLFCNRDEAQALSGLADLAGQMAVLGRGAAQVVIKLGAEGAALGGADGVALALPAPKVDVVDTTGAGDAFAAAFLAAQWRGEDDRASLGAAIAAGAEAVKKIGGQPG